VIIFGITQSGKSRLSRTLTQQRWSQWDFLDTSSLFSEELHPLPEDDPLAEIARYLRVREVQKGCHLAIHVVCSDNAESDLEANAEIYQRVINTMYQGDIPCLRIELLSQPQDVEKVETLTLSSYEIVAPDGRKHKYVGRIVTSICPSEEPRFSEEFITHLQLLLDRLVHSQTLTLCSPSDNLVTTALVFSPLSGRSKEYFRSRNGGNTNTSSWYSRFTAKPKDASVVPVQTYFNYCNLL